MSESGSRSELFKYAPLQSAGLIGRFGGLDLLFFASAVGVLVVGVNLLPQWGYLIAAVVVSLVLALIPLPRPGGRGLTDLAAVPVHRHMGHRVGPVITGDQGDRNDDQRHQHADLCHGGGQLLDAP